MAIQKGGLVSRAVREALDTLVSPQLSGQLIARALAAAGHKEIPESGSAIGKWIEGSLRNEIESSVGGDAAELVSSQLAPIVAHAASRAAAVATLPPAAFPSEKPTGVIPAQASAKLREEISRTARVHLTKEQMSKIAPHSEQPGSTARPQGEANSATLVIGDLPRVLAASAEPRAVEALRRYLEGSASVVHIVDLVGLLDALDEPNLTKPIVLIDCQRPTVHASSIAAIGEDLPPGTAIVLWGASETTWRELDRDRVAACRWVRCSQEATTDDVGSLCTMLFG
jgi:hypothetical protein